MHMPTSFFYCIAFVKGDKPKQFQNLEIKVSRKESSIFSKEYTVYYTPFWIYNNNELFFDYNCFILEIRLLCVVSRWMNAFMTRPLWIV